VGEGIHGPFLSGSGEGSAQEKEGAAQPHKSTTKPKPF
jgi:hypothetical protein